MRTIEPVEWAFKTFDALSAADMYEMLQLRSEVFVVEQNCVFLDMDGADCHALHVMGRRGGQLVAYARCFPAGIKFAEVSIGRVVTANQERGSGLGHLLMDQALKCVRSRWGVQAVRIGAQARLEKFYNRHDFVDVGRPYVEDGIDHLEMLWQP